VVHDTIIILLLGGGFVPKPKVSALSGQAAAATEALTLAFPARNCDASLSKYAKVCDGPPFLVRQPPRRRQLLKYFATPPIVYKIIFFLL
jgi:hypothetical protein